MQALFCCRFGRCGGTRPFIGSFPGGAPPPTLRSLALFGQMIFGAFCGLEYIAILAGESKHAARGIGQSVWISSPVICAMFVLGTSAVAAFSQPNHIDFIAPIPQTIRLALGHSGIGSLFAVTAILLVQMRLLAAASFLFTGVTRLPMTVGWDKLVPAWFTRLHPTMADSCEFNPMHFDTYLFVAGAGERRRARPGGLPTVIQRQPRALRACYLAMFAIPIAGATAHPSPRCRGGLNGRHSWVFVPRFLAC